MNDKLGKTPPETLFFDPLLKETVQSPYESLIQRLQYPRQYYELYKDSNVWTDPPP